MNVRRLCLLLGATAAMCGATASSPPAAPAEPTSVCDGTLSKGPYYGVTVPAGATCNLVGAVVQGDVNAESGSELNVTLRSTVNGNVTGDGALVQINESVVIGTVAISRAPDSVSGLSEVVVADSTIVGGGIVVRDSAGTILIDRNRVLNGDISVTSNFVPPFLDYPSQLSVRLNRVVGKVTVSRNTGPGPKEVHSNSVAGTLSCAENEQPFIGGPNFADNAEGDCF